MAERLRRIYTLVLYFLTPLLLVRLALLGVRNRGYWEGWPERLGFVPALPSAGLKLWVHAVSVGEAQAASALVRALLARVPPMTIMVTTTTPTGAATVRRLLRDEVRHCYLPFDLPVALRRFIERTRPAALVILETELWPNLLHCCRRARIPVFIANARLSERSFAGYRRWPASVRGMLAGVTAVAAQSPADAERFMALGVSESLVHVTGNIKFDVTTPRDLQDRASRLKREVAPGRRVWTAASTHEGEEAQVLSAFAVLHQRDPGLLLVLAPRHPERFGKVYDLCRQRGFATARRTAPSSERPDVFLADTMGELPLFYALSEVAFVGGSLVAVGGHNPLEPAALGVPVVSGPHIFNFTAVYDLLTASQAAWVVNDADELLSRLRIVLADSNLRATAGRRARAVVAENRGAVDRVMEILMPLLEPPANQTVAD
ncbi:MAG: lipid IV(A) 3-deoxy-D-manno-octulosonic acid transferase [Gammaproteobacteria bacterium]